MMRYFIALLLVIFISSYPGSGRAQDSNTGNYWHKECSMNVALECAIFVLGITQGLQYAQATGGWTPPFCASDKVSYGQRVDIFRRYLEAHPERRHFASGILFVQAMKEAFPCAR
jgi:hypothetical protein